MRIELHCPAEDRAIGTITGQPGTRIDAASFRSRYEAAPGYALAPHAVREGVPLLCPRCANPVVLAGNGHIPVVPGLMRFGPGGTHDVAQAG
jgi:hypothetical protein